MLYKVLQYRPPFGNYLVHPREEEKNSLYKSIISLNKLHLGDILSNLAQGALYPRLENRRIGRNNIIVTRSNRNYDIPKRNFFFDTFSAFRSCSHSIMHVNILPKLIINRRRNNKRAIINN